MKTIIVTTQAELDALPSSFPEFTEIRIRADKATEIVVRKAYDSSTVTAYDSSTVTACGSSTVTAYDSSTVTAYDSSTVTAYDSSTVRAYGSSATLDVLGFAVAVLWASAKIRQKGKYAKVVRQKILKAKTLAQWIDINGAEVKGQFVTLYKRVSAGLKTQEGEASETLWAIGSSLVVPNWDPAGSECGAGKFHGCPAPHYCDEFRSTTAGDRYVAIKVAKKDCHVWPDAQYPHKIAFRAGTVLHECDRNWRKIG